MSDGGHAKHTPVKNQRQQVKTPAGFSKRIIRVLRNDTAPLSPSALHPVRWGGAAGERGRGRGGGSGAPTREGMVVSWAAKWRNRLDSTCWITKKPPGLIAGWYSWQQGGGGGRGGGWAGSKRAGGTGQPRDRVPPPLLFHPTPKIRSSAFEIRSRCVWGAEPGG